MATKNRQDYVDVAKTQGFYFIGPMPANTRTKTTWQCQNKHRWAAKFSNIQAGSGCPHCANEKRRSLRTSTPWVDKTKPSPNSRLTIEDYKKAARNAGFVWTGNTIPLNTKEATTWRCSKGHNWNAPYTNIVFSKSGCRICRIENSRNGEEDYRQSGLNFSLSYIGPLPSNSTIQTWWECQAGHHFTKSLKKIKEGVGCPCCQKLLHRNHRSTGSRSLLLCNGITIKLGTLIEAETEQLYFNENSCGPGCKKNHSIVTL